MRGIFQSESWLQQKQIMTRLSTVNVTKQVLCLPNFATWLFGHVIKVQFMLYTALCSINDPSEVPGNESPRRIMLLMKAFQKLHL